MKIGTASSANLKKIDVVVYDSNDFLRVNAGRLNGRIIIDGGARESRYCAEQTCGRPNLLTYLYCPSSVSQASKDT